MAAEAARNACDPCASYGHLEWRVAVNSGRFKNVVVCLDRNANAVCDAGEPASAPPLLMASTR